MDLGEIGWDGVDWTDLDFGYPDILPVVFLNPSN
jgi:hypothetical protein